MPYILYIDDNYHYMDEEYRRRAGEFATLEDAMAQAKKIVDDYLLSAFRPGITVDQLMRSYLMFGEDPFIVTPDPDAIPFSARDYALLKCREMVECDG